MDAEAKVVEIIQVQHTVGRGTPEDPCRRAISYFWPDGRLLTRDDPDWRCRICGCGYVHGKAAPVCPDCVREGRGPLCGKCFEEHMHPNADIMGEECRARRGKPPGETPTGAPGLRNAGRGAVGKGGRGTSSLKKARRG